MTGTDNDIFASSTTIGREQVHAYLGKAFSKVAYLNSRAMDPDDFEQEMWLELYSWLGKHSTQGKITTGKHAGKVLMEQTPIFIAYRMAGRAAKNLWHLNRRNRAESSIDEMLEATGGEGDLSAMLPQSRGTSVKMLVLWAYRERGLLTPEVEEALTVMYRERQSVELAPTHETAPNYHISMGDTHEMALCKRFAALTGAEALDVLILLEEKGGRYAQAMRTVLECGGERYTTLKEMGVSCKYFTKAKKEIATMYD